MSNTFPKLHNAMWPGLVGKGDEEGQEPPISLEQMLDWTAAAEVDGQKFDGIDYFLFHPHTDPDASNDELKRIADLIASHGLVVGSLVAPIWPGTVGDSAMGDDEQQEKFLDAIHKACRIAAVFNDIDDDLTRLLPALGETAACQMALETLIPEFKSQYIMRILAIKLHK